MFRKLFISALVIAASVSAIAQTPAKDALTSINQIRQAEFAAARDAKKTPDFAAIDAKVKAKAEDAIKGLEVAKIDPKDAYDWAQVYQLAGRNKDVCDLMHAYLRTNPPADQKFNAQMLMMQSCNELGEADMLMSTLKDVRAVTPNNSSMLANYTAQQYADTIASHKGKSDAIRTLEAVERSLPKPDFNAQAKELFDANKKRHEANPNMKPDTRTDDEAMKAYTQQAHDQFDNARLSLIKKKADILVEQGKKDDAIRTLDDFGKGLDPSSGLLRSVKLSKNAITLPNSIAPAINIERGYGGFPGIEKLRGKVVVMDFFAHWCGPCRAAFPDMRQLLADYKDKGLEMVGVTTYYGFYKQEQKLSKDDEYARMNDFIKEENMTWPVVYGDKANFEAYGVQFIPYVVVLDKKGVVRTVHVGYDKEGFAKFRKEVEALLNEK